MAKTNTGKQAEKAIADALKQFADIAQFDYQRLYDATSARGAFVAQTGDYLLFSPQHHGVLEVKSTQHPERLSKSAFSDLQRAKLYKRTQAGGLVWVAVYHYTVGVWRLIPFAACYEAFNTQNKASLVDTHFSQFNHASELVSHLVAELFGVNHDTR